MKPIILAADIGTGAVKVEGFGADGVPTGSAVGTYPTTAANPETVDPEMWFHAFGDAIRSLGETIDLGSVKRLILSGQMQDLILVSGGRAVGTALMYYAARPGDAFDRYETEIGRSRIIEMTGNLPDTSGFPAKLFSLAAATEDAAALSAAEHILCGAHDFIAYRLTGFTATDRTTASTTGLFDPLSGRWVEDIVDLLPIETTILPEVVSADHLDGYIDPTIAAELGLGTGIEVVHGAGDVGTAMLATEDAGFSRSCYLGTSGWILDAGPLSRPADPEAGVFNLRHPTRGSLIRVAPLLTAAGAFDWFVSTLDHTGKSRDDLFDLLAREAAGLAPDEAGLLFLPYLAGERSPFRDPRASAGFIGIRNGTSRRELFRAVQEGVAFALRSVMNALTEGTGETSRDVGASGADVSLLLTGGGAMLHGFPRLLADILGIEIAVMQEARFNGLRALPGLLTDSGDGPVKTEVTRYKPRYKDDVYGEKYDLFREAYEHTKGIMHSLSEY